MYNKIKDAILKYDKIIIHRHSRPDGDALGSQLGLKYALKDNYPNKEVYAVGDISERLSFIGALDNITDDIYKGALVFVLDTPEEVMISDERYKLGDFIIKIDQIGRASCRERV